MSAIFPIAPDNALPESVRGKIYYSLKVAQKRIGWVGTPEQEQAALRVFIPLTFLSYLFISNLLSKPDLAGLTEGMIFITTFLIFATILFVATLVWRGPSNKIRIVGIIGDISALSLGLMVTGETGAPWYGVYLWVTLGNGFRYGEGYLYLSSAMSLIGFGCVAYSTPYWLSHGELAIGLAFTLLLIPAYSAILIRRLNEARQRADAASRAKSDFLSCMSHEIRTPLNGILGMTDLLRLRPLPTEDKECIETIHVSGHALARQINEILDLSKIEAGRMTVETVDFDLYVLVNTTMRIFQMQAQEKGLTLNSRIDPATPYLLSGDPHKIRQIITNLIGNALKFTHQGSIMLSISVITSEETKAMLRFEVMDTGTGIPEDKLQLIFEPFTQASDSVSRNYGGTGLGTTICKNLVELMGGSIGIESTLDVGTTFWFELPFGIKKTQADATVNNWASRCRVLYVSPSIQNDDVVSGKLAEWGISYDPYDSIEDACAQTATFGNYDALIVCNMPDSPLLTSLMNGTNTQLPEKVNLVIINNGEGYRTIQPEHPSLFILHSPLEDNKLLNVLHASYSKHGTEDEIVHFARKQLQEQRVDRRLSVLVSDDNATNRIVMQRMLDKLGHSHTIVNGGEAALLALERNRFDAVIIDKNMPDMGGVEVFQAYCFAHSGTAPVEFAILTADATEDARASCEAAGIKHFLTKPVSLARLAGTLSDMCGSASDTGQNQEYTPSEVNLPAETDDIIDEVAFNKLVELAGSDHSFMHEIVDNFIVDTNKNIRDMEVTVAKGDWLGFRDLAHGLKGSSLYLGLTHLAVLSKEAQDISQQDFRDRGINIIIAIRKAADSAFDLVSSKLSDHPNSKVAS